jgi:long-chain acyl-CoA synthetase
MIYGETLIPAARLTERVQRAASGFRALGIAPGSRVGLLLRNDPVFLEASLAAQMLGAYPVPINWHFEADEIMHVIDDSAPAVLVAHADLLDKIADRLPPELSILEVAPAEAPSGAGSPERGRGAPTGAPRREPQIWSVWIEGQERHLGEPLPATESLIYTSGTSGKPKGVRRELATAEVAAAGDRMRSQIFGIEAGSRVLVPSPVYHTAPNFFALRALRLAELLVLSPKFEPEAFLADIERHRITHVYAVPTIFVRLLELPADTRAAYDLSSLRFILHAGGPCSPSVKQRMIDWLGPVICEYYGSTEHGPLTFCDSFEWLGHKGTVGKAAYGVTLRIEDEDGRPLPTRQIGEITARNAAHPDFTYHNLEQERNALRSGDLIRTGDVGYLDEQGFLFLCDRKRDVVISGGVNIYPAEIEAVLAACPGVRDAAVFGIPDETYGEALVAVVQAIEPDSLDEAMIADFLAGRLARFKLPRQIAFVAALPREESGKIRKRLVREDYLARRPATQAGPDGNDPTLSEQEKA